MLPQLNPIDLAKTVSSGFSFAVNADEPGLLRVAVYGTTPITSDGVLLNLRFTSVNGVGWLLAGDIRADHVQRKLSFLIRSRGQARLPDYALDS